MKTVVVVDMAEVIVLIGIAVLLVVSIERSGWTNERGNEY